jgi:hypothetical protein
MDSWRFLGDIAVSSIRALRRAGQKDDAVSHYDVFNGDADGICALHQLRLAAPLTSMLVTGPKRDIRLLERVAAQPGDSVMVLDISLDSNRAALGRLLDGGVDVEYFDHHFSGAIPRHPRLRTHIDPSPGVCTSTLVDRCLEGRHRLWAIVAAFGDNLHPAALALARTCGLTPQRVVALRDLGQAINYNAYGDSEADLLIPPADLYRAIQPHASPFDFLASDDTGRLLQEGRCRDMAMAGGIDAAYRLPAGDVHVLPDAPWARRVQGEFANDLAARFPERALAVLCERAQGSYSVSVRAPLSRPAGAERLCLQYAGGGRAGAAGIDRLERERLPEFIRAFGAAFEPGHGQVRA